MFAKERKERITLDMTMSQAIDALSEGNPGAATVLVRVLHSDPLEGFFKMLNFDSYGIYGHKIWMLYKDVCGEDLEKTLSVMDQVRMGQMTVETLFHHIDNSIRIQ